MTRDTFMSEREIRDLEGMSTTELWLWLDKKGPHRGESVMSLLRSYRIAATVANAAWKVVKEAEGGAITPESFQALQQTLNLYSPGNFLPFQSDLEFGCRMLEELYDHLARWATPQGNTLQMLEALFERICEARTFLLSARPG